MLILTYRPVLCQFNFLSSLFLYPSNSAAGDWFLTYRRKRGQRQKTTTRSHLISRRLPAWQPAFPYIPPTGKGVPFSLKLPSRLSRLPQHSPLLSTGSFFFWLKNVPKCLASKMKHPPSTLSSLQKALPPSLHSQESWTR